MYTLILIDDDPISLRLLQNLYKWESYGFQLEGAFSDGSFAADFLKDHPVDLIISDIKMPNQSGLELAKLCYELYPETYFILVSAYRDFEYAQEATKYNVISYITKPFDLMAFKDAIQHAYKKIESVKNAPPTNHKTEFQKQMLSYMLCDKSISLSDISQEMKANGLDVNLLNTDCALFTMNFHHFQSYLDHTWKYGIERFYNNGIYSLLPVNPTFFCSLIRYSFDTAQFLCFPNHTISSFERAVSDYITGFEANLEQILKLTCETTNLQCFTSFREMRNVLLKGSNLSAQAAIPKAIEYMHAHYAENITLKEVADYISLSPVYFCRIFKQITNYTFIDYLRNIRLNKSLELLKNTDIPVVSVCELVGYKNITYFYNIVKSNTGMTPKEYRSHHQKEEE